MKRVLLSVLCLALFAVVLPGCKSLTARRHEQRIDDRAIVARIRTLISEDPALDPPAIRVFVEEGRVTLSGLFPMGKQNRVS